MNSTLVARTVVAQDGARLHCEGSGPAVALMLHGLGYASWETASLRAELPDEIGLWSLDNRGTGRSAASPTAVTIASLAADSAAAIEALGAPVVLIGHSMGGYVAQTLALLHPELVRGLVLIGTSAGGPGAVPVPPETARAWSDASELPPDEYARATMPLSFAPGWVDAHPARFEMLLRARLSTPTSREVWSGQYDAAQRFLADGIPAAEIAAPVLVIHGDADRVVPVANGRALASQLRAVDYHEVPGAGHLVHLEQPALVSELITTLVAQLPEERKLDAQD